MAEYTAADLKAKHTKWAGRVAMAKRFRDVRGNQDGRWNRNVEASAGDFTRVRGQIIDDPEAVDVNLIRPTMQTLLAPMWVNDPYITVQPLVPVVELEDGTILDNVRAAEFTEIELNYWIRELGLKSVLKKAITDQECTNHGYIYVGFTKSKREVEVDGERIEPRPEIEHRKPFIRRMSPVDVLVPPGIYDLEDGEWLCLLFRMRPEDVKARLNLPEIPTPTLRLYEDGELQTGGQIPSALLTYLAGDDCALCEMQICWDKRTKKGYSLVDGNGDICVEEDWPADFDGFPVVDSTAILVSDDYHGPPPMSFYLPQQIELNRARTATAKRENRAKNVVLASATLPKELKDAYQRAADGDWIEVNIGDEDDIRKKLLLDQGLPPRQGAYAEGAVAMQDLFLVSGLGAQQRSSGDRNAPTATASANIEKWVAVRQTDRGDVVRDAILNVVRKLWMMLKQFADEKRDRMVAGPMAGIYRRVRYSMRDLRGQFAFVLDVSAMLADNPALRNVRAVGNYTLLRQDPLVDPRQLVIDLYRAQNIANPEERLMFLRAPDEEFGLMIQGQPVEANERDDHATHMQAHEMQAQQLDQLLDSTSPEILRDESRGVAMRRTMLLLTAHVEHHMKLAAALVQQAPAGQGSDQTNVLRQTQAAEAEGGQTEAELLGEPLTGPEPAPAGAPV